MILAFSAVSSVMQFSYTPWLKKPLDLSDIQLIPNGPVSPTMPIQPLIKHSFGPFPVKQPDITVWHTMLDLGILLLELWHRSTFSDFIIKAGISAQNLDRFRYVAARQWAEESVHHIMPFYYDVVKICVECSFARAAGRPLEYQWDDENFRKSVCEQVLKPLWKECRFI